MRERRNKEKKERAPFELLTKICIAYGVLLAAGLIGLILHFIVIPMYREEKFCNLVQEMTEDERRLLINEFPDYADRIKEGKLYTSQYRKLEEIRFGMDYLERKYPGYKFRMNYIDGWAVTFDVCSISEEISGRDFKMNIWENEDEEFEAEDNFYGYFVEEQYTEYLMEQFSKREESVVQVITYMDYMRGEEYGSNMTIEDIVSGRLDVHPTITVFVAAKEITEEEYGEYEKKMQQVIEEIDLPGTYDIGFYNKTKEEILAGDDIGKCIHYFIIHW